VTVLSLNVPPMSRLGNDVPGVKLEKEHAGLNVQLKIGNVGESEASIAEIRRHAMKAYQSTETSPVVPWRG
jgi:hypothetical protein